MEIPKLVRFFGLPSQNLEFDKFLAENNIEDRPVFDLDTENPAEIISLPDQGMFLEFVQPGSYRAMHGSVREDGEMIFSEIFLYLRSEEGFAPYSGKILPDLSSDIRQDEVLVKFGSPSLIRDGNDQFGRPNTIEYAWENVNGFSVTIMFLKNPSVVRYIVVSPEKI
ncbi:hypothetical protein GCM10027093_54800 [Paraburkholderia jirisanensis]